MFDYFSMAFMIYFKYFIYLIFTNSKNEIEAILN